MKCCESVQPQRPLREELFRLLASIKTANLYEILVVLPHVATTTENRGGSRKHCRKYQEIMFIGIPDGMMSAYV